MRTWELAWAAALTAAGIAAFSIDLQSRRRVELGLHQDNALIIVSERLLSALKDVETGQRGYLLTGEDSYLAPYTAAIPQVNQQLRLLADLGVPLDGLSKAVDARVTMASNGIAVRRSDGLEGAVAAITAGRGKQLMDSVRDKVAAIQAAAQVRIGKRERRAHIQTAWLTAVALSTFAGAMTCVMLYALRRRFEAQALERQTRQSEARFRHLAEHSTAIIWTTSAEGRFVGEQTQWNAFTGQAQAATAESGWADAIHPDDRYRTLRSWSKAVAERRHFETEHRLRRADGQWRDMAVQGVAILGENGEVREWVGSHTDITERRRAEAALAEAKEAAEAANRSKSAFLANMSHELRTPLSAVIGYSEMLEEEVEELGHPQLLADLKKIESNARHLLSLINDVLDLSKIEANKMTSYAEDFDVAKLARDAAATVDALVRKNGNALRVEVGDDLGGMHSDVVKLRQCLFNLMSNAAKFTQNGQITLSVRRAADWFEFEVGDSGIGMTEEQMGRLFKRFEQADGSTTRNFGGTGLGLALTKAFCRLLGGDVTVRSRIGEGTVFTMRLPANIPDEVAETAELDRPAASARRTVLIVDDDPAQRELLTRFLEREGFDVRAAACGRTGLDLARALRPCAILLDVMMPQMDGWSVLTAIKADPDIADIPVIMASFVNEPALASALGAADYVLKPVEWDHLKEIMQRFIATEGAVLVVDDDPDARSRLRVVLERQGWIVTEAADGQEALQSIAVARPQVVLLDLTMPVMDGFEFLRALRAQPCGDDIPVVVLTARDLSKADRKRLDGADQVLQKGSVDLRDIPEQLAELSHKAGP